MRFCLKRSRDKEMLPRRLRRAGLLPGDVLVLGRPCYGAWRTPVQAARQAHPHQGTRADYFSMTYLPSLVTLTIGAWSAS